MFPPGKCEHPHRRPYSRNLQQHVFLMLQSCKTMKELSQVHGQIMVNGFSQKNFIIIKLLSFCIDSGDLLLQYATRAFNQVKMPSTTLLNQMIRSFSRSTTPESSILLYNNQMRRRGMEEAQQLNGFTYSFLLNACARASLLREGQQLHGRIVSSGFCSSVFVQTNLVNMYASAADYAILMARRVFDDMPQKNVVSWNTMLAGYLRSRSKEDVEASFKLFNEMPEKDVVSWTTMIAGCAQTGRCKQALLLFREMQRRAHVNADQVTMVAVLSACADLGDLELGKWIHHAYIDHCGGGELSHHLQGRGRGRLVSLNNSLIHMYVKCGAVEEGHRIFREMPRRSTVTWTTMIAGFAMHGRGKEALDLFWQMQYCIGEEEEEEKADGATFIAVLSACSNMGRIDEGRRHFKYMTQVCRIEPRIEHYGCMVDMLSRAGELSEARELIDTMPMEPNDVVWGALLGGCMIHRDVDLASYVADRLMELRPPEDQIAGYLVLQSNVYASAKRWDDALRIRQGMVEMGTRRKKPAGCSWIHVNIRESPP